MHHNTSFKLTIFACSLATSASSMANQGDFFLRPVFGISTISDTKGDSMAIGDTDGKAEVKLESGFNAGLGFGYHYTEQFAVELFWEYRSNDSETTLADGTQFNEGNYASNIFFLNGHYFLSTDDDWSPYVGAGLGWVQEIDIDLEADGAELSYSGDGDLTYQVFAGIDYKLNQDISINAEMRYQGLSSVDLSAEDGEPGSFSGFDYNPLTFQLGLTWKF